MFSVGVDLHDLSLPPQFRAVGKIVPAVRLLSSKFVPPLALPCGFVLA